MEEYLDFTAIWNQYNMSELQGKIDSLFPEFHFDFAELLKGILKGDVLDALSSGVQSVFSGMAGQLGGLRNVMLYLIVLGIVSALLAHFTDVFENHQIADISFYIVYLLLMAVLLKCFYEAASTAGTTIENIVTFIKVFIPTYFISVGVAGGAITALAYYQFMMIVLFGIEIVLKNIVLPFIYSYVLLSIINGIWSEEKLTVLLEFIQRCIQGILKASIGLVTGISLIQSMVTPVVDSLKSSAVQKAISAIPGVGNVADGVAEMVVGSAVLIKNSIGLVLLILLIAACLVPLLKLLLIAGLLKLSAALMGMISDKRITNCTNKVGEGSFMLFKTSGTVMVLFAITIAIAAYTTNRGF